MRTDLLAKLLMAKPKLSAKAHHLYLYLATRYNRRTNKCNANIRTISIDTGMSESTIDRAIRELKDANILRTVVTRRGEKCAAIQFEPQDPYNARRFHGIWSQEDHDELEPLEKGDMTS